MGSWWMVLGGTLLAALGFGLGSWRSGRALDDAYDQGWEASLRATQKADAQALAEGLVLVVGKEGPYWREPEEHPGREAWRDGYEAGCDDTEASMAPEPERIDIIPPDVTPPNGSRLLNDQQVRAELAALAEEPPRAGRDLSPHSGDGLTGVRLPAASETGPGHPASAVTDTHWIRLVGQEFYDAQRAWSEDLDWRLLTWAVGLMGKEGAGRMLEAAR
jgi:hypothetical protein